MILTAEQYKQKGNQYYRQEQFEEAIKEYTNAIIRDPSEAIYYTNRAICYYKLDKFEETEHDSQKALELDPSSMKGWYYLGLAQTELNHLASAEVNLVKAYNIALKQNSPSTPSIATSVIEVRRKKWEAKEKKRSESGSALLAEITDLLISKRNQNIATAGTLYSGPELEDEVEYENSQYNQKIKDLESIFNHAGSYSPKEVPDYLIDPISFHIFMDPVITNSGKSYERSWLLQYLKANNSDPLTREPLYKEQLISNLGLKAAAEAFIESEGES